MPPKNNETMTNKVSSEGLVDALVPYLRHGGHCSFLRFQHRDEVCRCGLEKAVVALRDSRSTIPNVDKMVEAACALLDALDAADSVKRGDFYHERKDLRAALNQGKASHDRD